MSLTLDLEAYIKHLKTKGIDVMTVEAYLVALKSSNVSVQLPKVQ